METAIIRNYAKPEKNGIYYLNWSNCINFIVSEDWDKISKIKNSEILFNLEGFDRVNLDGLMWLLLIGEILHKNNNYLILNLSKNEMILKYIKSVGFHEIASEFFEIYPIFYLDEIKEYKTKKGTKIKKVINVNLQNVKEEFRRFIESEEFAEMMDIKLTDQIFWEYVRPLLIPIISELLNNIIEHSGSTINSGHGYAAVFESGKKVNIFIADAGVGFRKGLERKGLFVKSEKEAIKKAFLFKYFQDNQDTEEVEVKGIFEVLKNLRKLGGWLRIRSGEAEGSFGFRREDVRLYKEQNEDEIVREMVEKELVIYQKGYFPGVQYSILIKKRKKDHHE